MAYDSIPAGRAKSTKGTKAGHTRTCQAEETRVHTRLQKLALGIEESRAYWANVDASPTPEARTLAAFTNRWFGGKSFARVRVLMPFLAARYDAFPSALAVLRAWSPMDPDTRRLVCHWHLQLSDPMYRRFTGEFLPARRGSLRDSLDRDVVLEWVRATFPGRWGEPTRVQFASKLLSAAYEAGLVSRAPDPRTLTMPRVPDEAVAYLLYLLREVEFEGTLADNPYLRSIGLEGMVLDHRLRAVRGVTLRRVGALADFEWDFADLQTWSERGR